MLDSDDFFEPDALEKMNEIIVKDKLIDFAYCDYFEIVGQKKEKVSLKDNIFKALGCGIIFKIYYDPGLGCFYRFHDFRNKGGYACNAIFGKTGRRL